MNANFASVSLSSLANSAANQIKTVAVEIKGTIIVRKNSNGRTKGRKWPRAHLKVKTLQMMQQLFYLLTIQKLSKMKVKPCLRLDALQKLSRRPSKK